MKRMPIDGAEGRRRFAAWLALLCMALLAPLCSGCRSTMDAAALREPLDEEAIDGIMGPTERRLRAADWQRRREQLTGGGAVYDGLEELDAAQELFDAGEYRAAETAFKKLARNRENRGKDVWTRIGDVFSSDKSSTGTLFGQYGDPIHEDALFMTAESQFAQKKYPWAQDSYAALLEKYPSSRHLDDVTQRLFFIARDWLRVPETPEPDNDIQLVSHESDGATTVAIDEVSGAAGWPLLPNLFDRTRPAFDTEGRAIQALETIWQHDATGPLADDALMLQATYAQRRGDFIEAARLYQLVRDEYPQSSHFEDAYVLGSHVTFASYGGANYDGKSLEVARDLKEIARTFPDLSPEQRERLERELEALQEAEIEREWALVEFYLRKNQPASVAVHCNRILNRYPETEYARRAWNVLQEQEAKLNGQSRFRLWPFVDEDDDSSATTTPTPIPDRSPVPTDSPESTATATPENGDAESGGLFRRFFLRPVERPPQLVEPPAEPDESDSPARVQL